MYDTESLNKHPIKTGTSKKRELKGN